MEKKSFFGALFDTSFSDFITPRVIKVLFIIAIVLTALAALGWIISAFTINVGLGVVALLILAPLGFFLYVLLVRIWLEALTILFRIQADVEEIKHKAKE